MEFLTECPIAIDLVDGENIKTINCHKSVSESKSEFFKALFSASFAENKTGMYRIESENPYLDVMILESLYTGEIDINEYSFAEKLTILLRYYFFGIELPKNFDELLFKSMTKGDCQYLIENYDSNLFKNINVVNKSLVKYVRLFLVDFDNSKDILRSIFGLSQDLFKLLVSQLLTKPMFASSRRAIDDFYSSYSYICKDYGERSINENEVEIYSHVPGIHKYLVFKCDHYVVYGILISLDYNSSCRKLDLSSFDDKKLFQICESSEDIIMSSKANVNDILSHRT